MERNALLLYLKNIRDLEFAQIKIQQRINEYNSSFSKKIDSLCQTDYARYMQGEVVHILLIHLWLI